MSTHQKKYAPFQNGIAVSDRDSINYVEHIPPVPLSDTVVAFWELRTSAPLSKDFEYIVMPDACIDVVFDLTNPKNQPLFMTPHLNIEKLLLGTSFHYIGIRFKPGTFTQSAPNIQNIVGKQLTMEYFSDINLWPLHSSLVKAKSSGERLSLLESFCSVLHTCGYTAKNPMINYVVSELYAGNSVERIALQSGYSSRQLRRITKQQTGYTPVQLHRVLRFQAVLSDDDTRLRFADESHLIKEFRSITGISYRQFFNLFH